MQVKPLVIAAIFLALASPFGLAQKVKVGSFHTTFREKNPLSDLPVQMKRIGWTKKVIQAHDPNYGYDLKKELFFVHVPKGYDPKKADKYGLFVWISPGDDGRPAQDWPAVLAKKKLIFIGANGCGNERYVWYRIALALDAVHNMKKQYRLDPDRIYVGGHSGGGRVASTIGLHFADVFAGGIYGCGTNHFRPIRRPQGGTSWPAKFKKPTGKLLGLTRKTSRHVFLNGETDFNRTHSRAVEKDLRGRQSFAHTKYIEMKSLGHIYPTAKYLELSFDALDKPMIEARKKKREREAKKAARRAEKLGKKKDQ